ncbi:MULTISPECIES: helix-turn-helix domain-containing protein [Flavobacterium]|jgi:transposase-like protein|uniref:Helix-turn-helix domain-containing protein n=1 Tax=Flavobacterium frigidarium TaxID=99286 RepID=A0ABV4KEF8_9FLAO|nr:helix-turn-helix domain-containing protein [Flavobacterium sp.]MDG2431926.1 helix-turn-helix domain-containing protein [Flavobacterium sp.]
METPENQPVRRRNGKQVSFEYKLSVIQQINNGQISLNFASKKYNISKSTIEYWMKKLTNYEQTTKSISKDDEIRLLKSKIEDLEAVKTFQQEIIIEFESVTGEELSKKYLPDWLANEIQRKKKKLLK